MTLAHVLILVEVDTLVVDRVQWRSFLGVDTVDPMAHSNKQLLIGKRQYGEVWKKAQVAVTQIGYKTSCEWRFLAIPSSLPFVVSFNIIYEF